MDRPPHAEAIPSLYERHAHDFDRDRSRALQEKAWIDRFLSHVSPSGTVLDIGCGTGEPIARYILEAGFHIVGVDTSPSMIALARTRFPASQWIVADMRHLALPRTFDGILAWDSFFHLSPEDQRAMFPRFRDHAGRGAPIMFTSGTACGEAIGSCFGEPLYHSSLDPEEYEKLLAENGLAVLSFRAADPECGAHTVWLAQHQ